MVPLIMAGIAAGTQIAKGISKYRAAKRTKNQANQMKAEGSKMVSDAFANKKDFTISSELYDNKTFAKNLMNSNDLALAMKANADMNAGNVASQINRAGVDGAAGAVAAEQMRLAGYNQADIAQAQQKNQNAGLVMTSNRDIANQKIMQYDENERTPFMLNYERGINLENQGIQGKIEADKMRTMAFGDMMNGLGSASMAVGNAFGSDSPFDVEGMKLNLGGLFKKKNQSPPNVDANYVQAGGIKED